MIKTKFKQSELDVLHDVVFNSLGKDLKENKEIIEYWNYLPDDIQLEAVKYGFSDTPTRDRMYVFFEANRCL